MIPLSACAVHSKVLHQKFGPGSDASPRSLPGGGFTCQSPHLGAGAGEGEQTLPRPRRSFSNSHPAAGVSSSLPFVRFGGRGCSAFRPFVPVVA